VPTAQSYSPSGPIVLLVLAIDRTVWWVPWGAWARKPVMYTSWVMVMRTHL
jgi:hypothetical protein